MLKLISWNIAQRRDPWQTLVDSDADLALLQEATPPPADLSLCFDVGPELWQTQGTGRTYSYRTALVVLKNRVKLTRIPAAPIAEATPAHLPVSRPGTIAAGRVEDPDTHQTYTILSLYGFWENARSSSQGWLYADGTLHRIISDLSILIDRQRGHRLIAAGDLNILRGYGDYGNAYWAARYQTVFDRFEAIGLECVGPHFPNGRQASPWPAELPARSLNVPTYRARLSAESATRQLDFVFASKEIASTVKATAINGVEDWGPSDHCQIRIEVG